MKREKADEMDLSREDRQRRDEEQEQQLLWCPCCGGEAFLNDKGVTSPLQGYARFPYAVSCSMKACGVTTPFVAMAELAMAIWNRRVGRKPARLIDSARATGHTPPRKPRSSGGGSAAGKRATGPKGAQSKRSQR